MAQILERSLGDVVRRRLLHGRSRSAPGLITYYVHFFTELSSRRVHVAGITRNPDSRFMLQIARILTDSFDGFLLGKRYLLLDHGGKYTAEFQKFLDDFGTNIVRLPVRSQT